MWCLSLTLTFVVLCVYPSSSNKLSKEDLQRAVDAFDGFVEPPRSNKAKDKPTTLLGGQTGVSTDDPYVKEIARFALSELDKLSGLDNKLGLVTIQKASRQIVAGTLTELTLEVGETDCRKSQSNIYCSVRGSGKDNTVCTVKIWDRPWLPKKELKSNTCTNGIAPSIRNVRKRRGAHLQGTPSETDKNAPHIIELAKFGMQEANKRFNSIYQYTVAEVLKATTQVVSGFKYVITVKASPTDCRNNGEGTKTNCAVNNNIPEKICNLEIWEQSWLNKTELTGMSCNDVAENLSAVRNKRRVGVPGAPYETDKNDPHVLALATFGMKEANQRLNNIYQYTLAEVLKATSQVVSGTLYNITVKASPTDCRNNGEKYKTNCAVINSVPEKICNLAIWEQSWLNKTELTGVSCNDVSEESPAVKNKRALGLVGAPSETDKNDPHVLELAKFGMEEANNRLNNIYQYTLAEVLRVTTQVVSGFKYVITVRASGTDCRNNGGDKKTNCAVNNNIPEMICNLEIWEQSWLNKTELLNVSCNDVSEKSSLVRNKRRSHITGAPVESSKDDPHVLELAKFGMKEANARLNNVHQYTLTEVLKASTQVVAGVLYRITVKVSPTDCLNNGGEKKTNCAVINNIPEMICDLQILEQPWLNKTELADVSCNDVSEKSSIARNKRTVVDNQIGMPAAFKVDANNPDVKDALQYAMGEINNRMNSMYMYKPTEIMSAKREIMDGDKYYITVKIAGTNCCKGKEEKNQDCCTVNKELPEKICDLQVWEQFWSKKKTLVDYDCKPSPPKNCAKNKREIADNSIEKSGASSNLDTSDPIVQNATKFGVQELNKRMNTMYIFIPVEIMNARRETGSQEKYFITVRIGGTNCRKGKNEKNEDCSVNRRFPEQVCHLQVQLNKLKLVDFDCTPVTSPSLSVRNKRDVSKNMILGAPVQGDATSPEIRKVAEFAIDKINEKSNSEYKLKHTEILSVTNQVVAGLITRMKLKAFYTDCKNNCKEKNKDCNINEDAGPAQICEMSIFEQSWNKIKDLLNYSCVPESSTSITLKKRRDIEIEESLKNFDFLEEELESFKNFMETHQKIYKTGQELRKRFRIFRANLKKINFLQISDQGTAKYGVNEFADLTKQEFKERYLGLNRELKTSSSYKMKKAEIPSDPIPDEFDWRSHGAVTEVKNQGMCGSCWAFSVTGNIEGQWAVNTGKLVSLSEQELVDCDTLDEGCNGGLPSLAYESIEKLGGLETETDYPYDAKRETCKFNKTIVKFGITGSLNISSNETEMAQWLVKNGPISIGINANAMQFYMGGVSHPWKVLCSPKDLDHGVLIVGYGVHRTRFTHKLKPYWLIKNSWGKRWGEKGYYRVYRGDGTCGVNMMASSATVN